MKRMFGCLLMYGLRCHSIGYAQALELLVKPLDHRYEILNCSYMYGAVQTADS